MRGTSRRCGRCASWRSRTACRSGAQPSYRDRENFGRADVEIGYADLVRDLTEQLEALQAVAREAGTEVTYLKPHGALYNRIVHDADQAKAVVDVALQFGLPLMTLPGSVAHRLAEDSGGRVIREFFADRAYDSRGPAGAALGRRIGHLRPRGVGERIRQLLATETVTAIDGDIGRARGRQHLRARGQPRALSPWPGPRATHSASRVQ